MQNESGFPSVFRLEKAFGCGRFAKSRPHTVCMTHLSHAYPRGANLYFIFIGLFKNKEEYVEYQYGIFDNIMNPGDTLGLDMTEDQKREPKYAGKTWEE